MCSLSPFASAEVAAAGRHAHPPHPCIPTPPRSLHGNSLRTAPPSARPARLASARLGSRIRVGRKRARRAKRREPEAGSAFKDTVSTGTRYYCCYCCCYCTELTSPAVGIQEVGEKQMLPQMRRVPRERGCANQCLGAICRMG